jgi:hypothetical protein
MPCFEIVGKGFNVEDDSTDHLVRWIKAPSLEAVMRFVSKGPPMPLEYPPSQMKGCDHYSFEDGVDWVIDEDGRIVDEAPAGRNRSAKAKSVKKESGPRPALTASDFAPIQELYMAAKEYLGLTQLTSAQSHRWRLIDAIKAVEQAAQQSQELFSVKEEAKLLYDYIGDDLEIGDNAIVDTAEDRSGYWVEAWVWVYNHDND